MMARKKSATKNGIVNLTVHEAAQMMKTIRSMLDMVVIVDPKEGMVWDIDENENFRPVQPCYCIWNKEGRCEACTPLASLEKGEVTSTFERKGDEVFHIFSRPVMIDGKRPYTS